MNLTYEQYMIVCYIGIIASGVFLTLSGVLFVLLKIPQTIGDLSGSNARKGIEEIRRQSEENIARTSKSSKKKSSRTSYTTGTGELIGTDNRMHTGVSTGKLKKNKSKKNEIPEETMVLEDGNNTSDETKLLVNDDMAFDAEDNQTSVLTLENYSQNGYNGSDKGTVIADEVEYFGQTTVLGDDAQELVQVADPSADSYFSIVDEVTLFFSNEIIA